MVGRYAWLRAGVYRAAYMDLKLTLNAFKARLKWI